MKMISKILPCLVLLAYGVMSLSIVDDVRIETKNGFLYCDSMICPPNALCRVTKRNDPNDFSQIIRKRKCFDTNGAIIAQETIYEPNRSQGDVNINIVSGGGGGNGVNIVQRPLTPQEQRVLEETLRRTDESLRPLRDGTFERNLRNEINEEVFRRTDEHLRPFRDGTFERNLRNHISESINSAFKF